MAGLSSTGFSTKRLENIIAEMKASAATELAPFVSPGDIVNTSDTSVVGRFIKLFAAPIADLWQVAQDVYSAADINQATDQALENLTLQGGVARKSATSSTARLVCYGTYGTVIPIDSNVKSGTTGLVFATDNEITLDETLCTAMQVSATTVSNSTVYSFTYQIYGINSTPVTVSITSDSSATQSEIINAIITEVNTNHSTDLNAVLVGTEALISINNQNYSCTFNVGSTWTISKIKKGVGSSCTVTGPNSQDANTIQSIQSPVIGWETVTNPYAASAGTNIQTDAELRLEYFDAKFQDSNNTYESIYAALLKIEGVTRVIIYENETDVALVSPPVPAHSFYPIVIGGNTQEIGQAIWDNKPAGILSYGTVPVTVVDSQGVSHTVSFDRPTDLPIYISVSVTKDSKYPVDGDAQIKQALVDYIATLNIGDDVLYSRLYTPVNSVPGHYITSLTIGTSPSPVGTSNITVDYYKKALLTTANVSVTSV